VRRQLQAATDRKWLHGLYNAVDQLSQIQLLSAHELLAGVRPIEHEQLAYQPTHACCVFAQANQQIPILL
jgi:hypothetical protein